MDRSIFPEGVEVKQDDLERTESTKAFHILQRHKDTSILGVVSGLTVTINIGNSTLIDVSAGNGYSPNGEFVELTTAQTGISLSDYTNGIVNLVTLVYTETNTELEPHETNGNSFATSAVRSSRLRIFTQAEFDALPESDDNLTNDAQDRVLILARVTAQGTGVALTTSNITNATTFQNAITASNDTNNITGVSIFSVDRTTSSGTGSLQFTFSTTELKWKAPGEAVFGAPTLLTTSGLFTVTSAAGKTIQILVVFASLPVSDQTDTITISNIYTQNTPRFSAEDTQHRSLLGSGTPTVTNPHGLTLEDLGVNTGTIETHQDLFHSNGILRTSASNVLEPSVNIASAPDSIDIVVPIAGDAFYINGVEHNILSIGNITFTDVGVDQQSLWDIYAVEGVNGIATLEKFERIRYDDTPPPALSTVVQLKDLDRTLAAGAAKIFFDDTSDTLSFYISTDTNFASPIEHNFAVKVPTTESTIRLLNESGTNYIDLFVDALGNWGGLDGGGDITEDLTILALPTVDQLEDRFHLATVMFSGNATGFLGNGFGASNSPNSLLDKRLFGITGRNDLSDDVNTLIDERIDLKTPVEVVVGTGIGDSIGDFNITDFSSAATAIQAAMDSIANSTSGGGVVHIKSGIYNFNASTDRIIFSTKHDGITLQGSSPLSNSNNGTSFVVTSGTLTNDNIITIESNVSDWGFRRIRFNVAIDIASGGGPIVSFIASRGSNGAFDKCKFEITSNQSSTTLYSVSLLSTTNDVENIQFNSCRFNGLSGGVLFGHIRCVGDSTSTFSMRFITVDGCQIFDGPRGADASIFVAGVKYFTLKNSTFIYTSILTASHQFIILRGNGSESTRFARITGNLFEGNTTLGSLDEAIVAGVAGSGDAVNGCIIKDNFFFDVFNGVVIENGIVTNSICADNIFAGVGNDVVQFDGDSGSDNHIIKSNIMDDYTSGVTLFNITGTHVGDNVIIDGNIAGSNTTIVGNVRLETTGSRYITSNNILAATSSNSMTIENEDVTVVNNIVRSSNLNNIEIRNTCKRVSLIGNVINGGGASGGFGVSLIRSTTTGLQQVSAVGNIIVALDDRAFKINVDNSTSGNDWATLLTGNIFDTDSGSGLEISTSAGAILPSAAKPNGIIVNGNYMKSADITINVRTLANNSDAPRMVVNGNFLQAGVTDVLGGNGYPFIASNNIARSSRLGSGSVLSALISVGNSVDDLQSGANSDTIIGIESDAIAIGNYVEAVGTNQPSGSAIGISVGTNNDNLDSGNVVIGNRVEQVGSGSTQSAQCFTATVDDRAILIGNVAVNATGTINQQSFSISTGSSPDVTYALNVTNGLTESATATNTFPENQGGGALYQWSNSVGADRANMIL